MNREKLKAYLQDNFDQLKRLVAQLDSHNGDTAEFDFYENDEHFFNTFFYENPFEAARHIYFGDYRFTDKYVNFDANDNLVSVSQEGLEDFLAHENIDEILNILELALPGVYSELSDEVKEVLADDEEDTDGLE